MRFINDEVIKIVFLKKIQIQGDTLDCSAHNVRVCFFLIVGKFPNGNFGPQSAKSIKSLIDKFDRMGNEQHSAAQAFGV